MESKKLPTVSLLTDPLPEPHMARAIEPRFARLLMLDRQGWMRQLTYDGFTDTDVETLETFLQDSFNELKLAENLARLLKGIHDASDESEISEALLQWTRDSGWNNIWEAVCSRKFPDPIAAAAYTGRHLLDIASSTLAFERMRREPHDPADDWNMSEAELKEGTELAEMGLMEDAAEWPPY